MSVPAQCKNKSGVHSTLSSQYRCPACRLKRPMVGQTGSLSATAQSLNQVAERARLSRRVELAFYEYGLSHEPSFADAEDVIYQRLEDNRMQSVARMDRVAGLPFQVGESPREMSTNFGMRVSSENMSARMKLGPEQSGFHSCIIEDFQSSVVDGKVFSFRECLISDDSAPIAIKRGASIDSCVVNGALEVDEAKASNSYVSGMVASRDSEMENVHSDQFIRIVSWEERSRVVGGSADRGWFVYGYLPYFEVTEPDQFVVCDYDDFEGDPLDSFVLRDDTTFMAIGDYERVFGAFESDRSGPSDSQLGLMRTFQEVSRRPQDGSRGTRLSPDNIEAWCYAVDAGAFDARTGEVVDEGALIVAGTMFQNAER